MLVEINTILVSFDVFFFFTNVPVGEAVTSIMRKTSKGQDAEVQDTVFLSPEQIAELLEMCLRST